MKLFFDLRKNRLTQKFGENKLPIYREMGLKGHNGLDFKYYNGEPIEWPCDLEGTVIRTEIDSKGGIGVDVLVNDNGFYYKLRFWHLKKWMCKIGDKVQRGQWFTTAGNTGYSTGSHLHFGLKPVIFKDGIWINRLQQNGFFGAIDALPFVVNTGKSKIIEYIKTQIEIIKKVVRLMLEQLKLLKKNESD